MKEKLHIQTKDEFFTESKKGWNWKEEDKAITKSRLSYDIKRLKREIEEKQEKLEEIKPETFEEYQEKNTYEDWVRNIRKNNDEYEIVENKDSKGVSK